MQIPILVQPQENFTRYQCLYKAKQSICSVYTVQSVKISIYGKV